MSLCATQALPGLIQSRWAWPRFGADLWRLVASADVIVFSAVQVVVLASRARQSCSLVVFVVVVVVVESSEPFAIPPRQTTTISSTTCEHDYALVGHDSSPCCLRSQSSVVLAGLREDPALRQQWEDHANRPQTSPTPVDHALSQARRLARCCPAGEGRQGLGREHPAG